MHTGSFGGGPEGRSPLGRPRRRWKDNILREVGWGHGLDRSGSGYGQVGCCCECCNERSSFIKCGQFLTS